MSHFHSLFSPSLSVSLFFFSFLFLSTLQVTAYRQRSFPSLPLSPSSSSSSSSPSFSSPSISHVVLAITFPQSFHFDISSVTRYLLYQSAVGVYGCVLFTSETERLSQVILRESQQNANLPLLSVKHVSLEHTEFRNGSSLCEEFHLKRCWVGRLRAYDLVFAPSGLTISDVLSHFFHTSSLIRVQSSVKDVFVLFHHVCSPATHCFEQTSFHEFVTPLSSLFLSSYADVTSFSPTATNIPLYLLSRIVTAFEGRSGDITSRPVTPCEIVALSSKRLPVSCVNRHSREWTEWVDRWYYGGNASHIVYKKLLFTGTGHSGTLFISTTLSECGFSVTHDTYYHGYQMGSVGGSSYALIINSYAIRGKVKRLIPAGRYRFDNVIHIHRDTERAISSRTNSQWLTTREAVNWSPLAYQFDNRIMLDHEKLDLVSTIHHWVSHNQFVEQLSDQFVHVENEREIASVLDEYIPFSKSNCSLASNQTNHKISHGKYDWNDYLSTGDEYTAMASTMSWSYGYGTPYTPHFRAIRRIPPDPLVTSTTFSSHGFQKEWGINGPCVVRLPKWYLMRNKLSILHKMNQSDSSMFVTRNKVYVMYVAQHIGKCIGVAVSHHLSGPWIPQDPVLCLDDIPFLKRTTRQHIASPYVVVDHKRKRFLLFYHGMYRVNGEPQNTFVSVSDDPFSFRNEKCQNPLGKSYFSVFSVRQRMYATSNFGTLYQAPEDFMENPCESKGWEMRPNDLGVSILPKDVTLRHSHVFVGDEKFGLIFFSCRGDTPERIYVSVLNLHDDWSHWELGEIREVLISKVLWEGGLAPVTTSQNGPSNQRVVQFQLQDPFVWTEDEGIYLFYVGGGEKGVGIARLCSGVGMKWDWAVEEEKEEERREERWTLMKELNSSIQSTGVRKKK